MSDGNYDFGLSAFDQVFQTVASQNEQAQGKPCRAGAAPVTVGVLVTLSSPNNGGRGLHELEGFAASQAEANNSSDCVHPIQLLVGQMGATEQAAEQVAQLLANTPGIVAVVGLGQSNQRSAEAVQTLAMGHIPMVSDLITAEGFDQNGSRDDNPDFTACTDDDIFDKGIGKGFYYRVAYRIATQVQRLSEYLKKADLIITPTTATDPFTCTALPLIHRKFGSTVHEVRFDPTDPSTVNVAVQQLCDSEQDVTAIYAARAGDLSSFLNAIDRRYQDQACKARSIAVASISDASRIRAPEPDSQLENLRAKALASLRNGKVRLFYTGLANPDVLKKKNSGIAGFANLWNQFANLQFSQTDLDDGWAINAYDSLTTVTDTLKYLPAKSRITPGAINSSIGSFSRGHPVPFAAQGSLTFDNNGNRDDSDPDSHPLVSQVCPPPANGQPPHSTSVEVYPTEERCPE
ncbi:MAG: ABC transporter substrate-binding protein [Pseudonocardia sp.]|nr:ABC transporter substrate-binding protein [Pseudonocardia sp.]